MVFVCICLIVMNLWTYQNIYPCCFWFWAWILLAVWNNRVDRHRLEGMELTKMIFISVDFRQWGAWKFKVRKTWHSNLYWVAATKGFGAVKLLMEVHGTGKTFGGYLTAMSFSIVFDTRHLISPMHFQTCLYFVHVAVAVARPLILCLVWSPMYQGDLTNLLKRWLSNNNNVINPR